MGPLLGHRYDRWHSVFGCAVPFRITTRFPCRNAVFVNNFYGSMSNYAVRFIYMVKYDIKTITQSWVFCFFNDWLGLNQEVHLFFWLIKLKILSSHANIILLDHTFYWTYIAKNMDLVNVGTLEFGINTILFYELKILSFTIKN